MYEEYLLELMKMAGLLDRPKIFLFNICSRMLVTPFDVVVKLDENRVEDARNIRYQIEERLSIKVNFQISVLEVLIGLVFRYSDISDDNNLRNIFLLFMNNLGINYSDREIDANEKIYLDIDEKIYDFIHRNMRNDSRLFPVHNTKYLNGAEIWYQMQAYINENFV